ncbi:MAG: HEPN domain-containing protein [Flavobacteriaceae bacterium]
MNDVLKWIKISEKDIEASRILYKNNCFSQSYFYFQQSTEKGNKALWMLLGSLNEQEFKKLGHNQFKPLRKIAYQQKENVDFLMSINDNISFISSNPFFKNLELHEQSEQLNELITFIDKSYSSDLINISISELDEILNTLEQLKNAKLTLPKNYKVILRKGIIDYTEWLRNFNSNGLKEERIEFERILNNDKDFEELISFSASFIKTIYNLIYTQLVFFFCSVLTIQHSSTTRYPDSEKKTNPLELYNIELPIIKKQKEFLSHLENALKKLITISKKYKPSIEKKDKKEEKHLFPAPKYDSSWKSFGVKNKRDFINKLLVSKNCHEKVPDQIVKELEFSEHIQSHSYYFYPMYGDAFSRQTRVFEMAIKSRCKELNIDIGKKRLGKLINEISINYPKEFSLNLDWARKMRNMNAHPEMTNMYGTIIKKPLLKITNIINDIFRDSSFFHEEIDQLKKLKKDYAKFKNGLWKLDKYLIHSIEPIAYRNGYSLWVFYPIYNTYPQKKDDLISLKPFHAYLKMHKGSEKKFIGKNSNNILIEMKKTNKKENIQILTNYKLQYKQSPNEIKKIMKMINNQNISFIYEEFKHKFNNVEK